MDLPYVRSHAMDAPGRHRHRHLPELSTASASVTQRLEPTLPSPAFRPGPLVQGSLDYLGAVGPQHIVSLGNSDIQVHGRDGTLVQRVSAAEFFGASGFDDRVIYDALAARWVAVRCGSSSGLYFAVSQTADPTGAWDLHAMDGTQLGGTPDGGTGGGLDYPMLGFNSRWVAVQVTYCGGSTGIFCGSTKHSLAVVDKQALYEQRQLVFTSFNEVSNARLEPASTYDPAEADLRVLSATGQGIDVRVVSGGTTTPTLSEPVRVGPPSNWGAPTPTNVLPQSGTDALIEVDEVDRAVPIFRLGHLWSAHTVVVAGPPQRTAVMWLQISAAGVLVQQALLGDSAHWYSAPSIAVNQHGDVLIGFSRFSPLEHPSAAYAYRAATDPPDGFRQCQFPRSWGHF